jgi:D-alanine-D-alanine ligase
MPRTRLVVLFGGRSAEHEVSCVSARHVLDAVDRSRYEVVAIGITRDGRWLGADAAIAALPAGAASLPSPDDLVGTTEEVDPLPAVTAAEGGAVVVFPLLHGPMGEDGTVQGLLELAGVPYVGAGVLASSLCMDKGTAKDVLGAHGLPQPRFVCRREPDLGSDHLVAIAKELGLPVFVKPANMGSSVGVRRAGSAEDLEEAVAGALRYDEYVVIEEALVQPREIEVAVLGNADPRASLPGEVVPSHDFYDFEDKYEAGTAGLRIPAPLDEGEVAEAQSLALAAYQALRVDGMARVDLFYEPAGRGFLVNEVNTIPGFTPISMYPRLWEASGLTYATLVDELVRLAVERHRRRSTFATTR